MTIYIAGKITGDPHYRKKFAQAEAMLCNRGHIAINPAVLPEGLRWEQYMAMCLPMVEVADAIYLLGDWKSSRGAMDEHIHAVRLGKEILFEKEDAHELAKGRNR